MGVGSMIVASLVGGVIVGVVLVLLSDEWLWPLW